MAEDLISRYIDRASFEADTKFALAQLEALEADFKKLKNSRVDLRNVAGSKNIADEIKQARLETEQLKQKNLELNAAIKEQRIEAAKLRADRKAAADEEKLRIENEKKAAAERRALEIEKNRSLAEQKKRQEELAEIERQRLETEKQRHDLGTYEIPQGSGQSGPGKLTRPNSEPFIPQTERESSILYLSQLQAGLKGNTEAQKELQAQLKSGTITQAEFDKAIVQAKLKEVEYREIIKQTSAEIKARAAAELSVKGTIDAARAENALLIKQRDQIPVGDFADPEDIARVKELNEQIDRNNDLIQKNVDALGQQKINIGNYPTVFGSAFKTLNKELDDVQSKISSGAFKGKELDELTRKLNALQRATGLTGKEFASSSAEAKAYKEASIQIGQVYGKNSDVFKTFSKQVKDGNINLKGLAKETDGAAKSTSKLGGAFKTAYGGLRTLANLIPGLGIGSALLLLLVPLQSLGAAFIKMFKTINEGKITIQTLNDVNLKAVEIFTKQTTEVEALASVTKDQSASLDVRKDSLEKLIALNPDYLRGLTLENINTDEGREILDKYNLSLAKKAELQAAQVVNQNANLVVANLNAEKEALIELSKAGKVNFNDLSETQQKYLGTFNTFTANFKFTASLLNTAISKNDIKTILSGIDDEIKTESSKVNASLNIYKQKFAENLNSDTGVKGIIEGLQEKINELQKIQPTLISESAIKDNVAQIKKLQDEINRLLGKSTTSSLSKSYEDAQRLLEQFRGKNLKALSQYSQDNLKILQDMYKGQMNDQNASEKDRLGALQKYHDISLELLKKQKEEQEKSLSSEVSKAKADASKISNAKLRAATLVEIEQYQANQLKVINQQFGNEVTKLDNETASQRVTISQQAWDKIMKKSKEAADFIRKQQEEAYKNVLRQADIDKYDELMALQEAYQKGSIKSIEEYNKKRQEIEDRAIEKQKKAELERLKVQERVFEALYGIQNLDIIKQIKALEFEISDNTNKKILDSDKALLDAQRELHEKKKELLHAGLDAVSELAAGQFEKQNEIDEARFKKQQEAAVREKELIENSALSQEEKEERIKMIDERTEARQRELDERQRQRAIQQAKFDKAMSILNIGVKTAETVFALSAKAALANPAMKPVILAQIPWVLGMSALEIGLILAKPLPKFKHGKKNNYEGPAIVGDGGVSEFMVRKDGTIEKTPATDTLTYVGKDDIVYPNLSAFLKSISMPVLSGVPMQKNDSNSSIKELKPYLERIANKRELKLQSNQAGMQAIWKWGSRQVRYVNQNTNW